MAAVEVFAGRGSAPGWRRAGAARVAVGVVAVFVATLTVLLGAASPARADAIRDKQWHLDFLKVAQLHKITTGKGATVAVVDSGVDGDHADLAGNVLKGKDFVDGKDAWQDTLGHGTAMASLIAGHGHGSGGRDGVLGLAPEAKILPGRVRFEKGVAADTDRAIDWAVEQNVGVMNLSFAGTGGLSHIENALKNDVVVVAGAGNIKQGDSIVQYPAAYPGVIAVSGVDRNGNFSEKSAQGPEVVLAAPMMDITAAGAGKRGTYATGTGTSDSAAIVSGVAALIRAKYPDISANGVINRLIKTADDTGPPGRDAKYGFGVINPVKALTADIPDIDYNPLIEDGNSSPSASPSATIAGPGKAGDEEPDDGYLVAALAGSAALVVLAGLGAYFIGLARRSRRSPTVAGPPLTGGSGAPPPGPPRGGSPWGDRPPEGRP